MIDANKHIGTCDVLFITLDTLRYDAAEAATAAGMTPELAGVLPDGQWERRHSPGNFTYAAHHAFFAGFLPTPVGPGPHPRLFAARFPGSETTCDETFVFDAPDLASGLTKCGYRTICVGGVGFFNGRSPLGEVFARMFQESYWAPELGVTDPQSTENQVKLAVDRLRSLDDKERVFLFLNVAAIHQPNCSYLEGATEDSVQSQSAALAYTDRHLGRLIRQFRRRAPLLCIITSDHGTAYGEDGYHGHRVAHPVVWDVPYAEMLLDPLPVLRPIGSAGRGV